MQCAWKDCTSLRTTLEDPNIDEAKAFEALTQLSVLVRLLSAKHHELVPYNNEICDGESFKATEILHVNNQATDIEGVIEVVTLEFSSRPNVLQVVAVPYYASFPMYDFFVLHRVNRCWKIAAGYQCKQGNESPTAEASRDVPLSVWVEGNCRKYRVQENGARLPRKKFRNWELLWEPEQVQMLGVSVSEALPQECCAVNEGHCKYQCSAEGYLKDKAKEIESSGSSNEASPEGNKNTKTITVESKKARTS